MTPTPHKKLGSKIKNVLEMTLKQFLLISPEFFQIFFICCGPQINFLRLAVNIINKSKKGSSHPKIQTVAANSFDSFSALIR